jgi:hypothetical protein
MPQPDLKALIQNYIFAGQRLLSLIDGLPDDRGWPDGQGEWPDEMTRSDRDKFLSLFPDAFADLERRRDDLFSALVDLGERSLAFEVKNKRLPIDSDLEHAIHRWKLEWEDFSSDPLNKRIKWVDSTRLQQWDDFGHELLKWEFVRRPTLPASVSSDQEDVPKHAPDFSWIRCDLGVFDFTPAQRSVVQALWEDWEQDGLGLSGAYLTDRTGTEPKEFRNVFKGHPAWKTLIITAGRSDMYRLALPPFTRK